MLPSTIRGGVVRYVCVCERERVREVVINYLSMVTRKKKNRKEKKSSIVPVPNFKYLCLCARSLSSRSLMQQAETVISVLAALYQVTECPLLRNIKTYTRPENT